MKKLTNQHGDVILEKVNSIPSNAKRVKIKEKAFIVERGEGIHTHSLICDSVDDFISNCELFETNDALYIRVKEGKSINLIHEEHGVQILQENIYKKHKEREFDYEKEIERPVID